MTITLTAPSRLHFGLFSVGGSAEHEFGGLGLMIDDPKTVVQVTHAKRLSVEGKSAETAKKAVDRWVAHYAETLGARVQSVHDLPCKVAVLSAPSRHVGLGSGTQIAMSVGTALCRYFQLPLPTTPNLAVMLNRGGRSAIGTYGFRSGGLLLDSGKSDSQYIAPVNVRVDFPTDWPIVLAIASNARGLKGKTENAAFARLDAVSKSKRQSMMELARHVILPSVIGRNYDQFAESTYEFGRESGMFFHAVQGGAYNGPRVASLVEEIRNFGVGAVGQSSWGPCVFAVTRHDKQANDLMQHLKIAGGDCRLVVTKANNTGAQAMDSAVLAK